ncbi:conserved hypothetical protein [Thermanaerovibrio acidaminovorans DSM 6589]|jgi:predicted secreted protein|uniref:Uncharacterized protein n=1 Tax=Thermanaerovibrio acidaminovorans (strain ATCC 49978 / DSM 6589 / Su883) TaxID=525903 RepID=D1B8M3_THEAS|nr:conserved hypothetical protein [Thermanaerovibrio acidaminovorans DSM 6589]
MERSYRLVVLCHCILNANAIVDGEARYPGAMGEFLAPLVAEGTGIIQLPCPESTFLGLRRCPMGVEQYDSPAFRRHCSRILEPFMDQIQDALQNGVQVLGVVGVKGSPSCGVTATCTGRMSPDTRKVVDFAVRYGSAGVFIQVLRRELLARGIDLPMTDVDNGDPSSASWKAAREELTAEAAEAPARGGSNIFVPPLHISSGF